MKKILIIRFSSIGDIVLTTPVIRCLKKKFGSQVEIHYLTKKQFVPLLMHNAYLFKIHQISENSKDVLKDLKKENFDLVIDLHKNLRTIILKLKLGKKSYSFEKLNIKKWLLVNLRIDLLPKKHIVDRYMDTLASLAVSNDGLGLDFFVSPEKEKALTILPPKYISDGYIALAAGGTYKGKRLTPEMVLAICKSTSSNIVLIGGPKEQVFGGFLAQHKTHNVFDACGKVDLLQSASLVKHALAVITTDTGFMHIAAAFKKKIISLWGCTTPSLGMYPYLPHQSSIILEPENHPKRPCSKLGNRCKYHDFECIKNIETKTIKKAINSILK